MSAHINIEPASLPTNDENASVCTADVEASRPVQRLGYASMLGLTIVLAVLAAITVLPLSASKPNVLGYVSCCSFAPWSTLTLLSLAGLSCVIRSRSFKQPREAKLDSGPVHGTGNTLPRSPVLAGRMHRRG